MSRRSELDADRGVVSRDTRWMRAMDSPWWLVPILLAGALPRVIDAWRTPLIFDEIYAVMLARRGAAGLIEVLSRDVDQPLHFLVVWAWRAVVGDGDFRLRIPALLFALATLVVTWALARRLFGPLAGVVAAALMAFQPTHILYSYELRFHALVWFLSTLLLWLTARWIERPRPGDAIAIVLAGAASLYTDTFSIFVMLGALAWGLVALPQGRRGRWVALFVVALVLYAPQAPTLLTQLGRDIAGERALPPISLEEMFDLARKLAFNALNLLPIVAILIALALVRRPTRRSARGLLVAALVPVVVPFALSHAGIHLFINRQMLFTMPIVCTLAAAGVASLGPAPLRGIVAAALVALAARTCWLRGGLAETVDLPRALAWIDAHGGHDDPILAAETRGLLFAWRYRPWADARLLVIPGDEPFHYSDGVLIVPEAQKIDPTAWRAHTAGRAWWGIRLEHSGRDGVRAAAQLDGLAGPPRRFGRVSVWRIAPGAPPR